MSQSSTNVIAMESDLKERYPHGETKRQALEDINETLEDANVFL